MGKVCGALAWERGSMGISPLTVTLQQVELKGNTLAMALVCEGEGTERNPAQASGYLCESMVGWFHEVLLPYVKEDAEPGEEIIKALLRCRWEQCLTEWKSHAEKRMQCDKIHISGILLWNGYFVAWGNRPVYVINRRFHRLRLKKLLAGEDEMSFAEGGVRGRLRFYLGSSAIPEYTKEEEVLECLHGEGSMDEKKLERRIKELVSVVCQRCGKKSAGAVILEVEEC